MVAAQRQEQRQECKQPGHTVGAGTIGCAASEQDLLSGGSTDLGRECLSCLGQTGASEALENPATLTELSVRTCCQAN